MTLKQFTIDEQYICEVQLRQEWGMYDKIPPNELTPEQVFEILKGEDRCSSTSSKDHPMFTELREQLEREGYIQVDRGCWNGDRVKKGFKLNEWTFKKGGKFACASAMNNSIQCARKFKWKSISTI
jgi:hypothetical protein